MKIKDIKKVIVYGKKKTIVWVSKNNEKEIHRFRDLGRMNEELTVIDFLVMNGALKLDQIETEN